MKMGVFITFFVTAVWGIRIFSPANISFLFQNALLHTCAALGTMAI
jgi:hypothetical protein